MNKNESVSFRRARILVFTIRDDPNNAPLLDEAKFHSLLALLYHSWVKVVAQVDCQDYLMLSDDTLSVPTVNEQKMKSLVQLCHDEQVNVVYCSHPQSRMVLARLLHELSQSGAPSSGKKADIEWIHTRSAGIDFVVSPELAAWHRGGVESSSVSPDTPPLRHVMTNAKGCFSSTLAEYTMLAISYFAKDLPRLLRNYEQKHWDSYAIREIRGSTLGIVGYGDIGQAAARLALAYGMNVVALTRTRKQPRVPDEKQSPEQRSAVVVYSSEEDTAPNEHLNRVFSDSDYVLCTLPLTHDTRTLIGSTQFQCLGPDGVFINVGRGPVVDEEALVKALQQRVIRGAALDVMCTEPLPLDSELWTLPPSTLLLSPHNMDKTATFMVESTTFFIQQQLPRFVGREQELLNPVNPELGY
jgi:phosphoglycerate dehydrogenase-like enzyme